MAPIANNNGKRTVQYADNYLVDKVVLGGHPVSNRNTLAQLQPFLVVQSISIRHSTTWALHSSHGNIHDNPYSMRTIFQLEC